MSHFIDLVVAAAKPATGTSSGTTAVNAVLTQVRNVVSPILLIVIGFAGLRFIFNHKIMEAIIFFVMAIFVAIVWFNPAIVANIGDGIGSATGIGGDSYTSGN